METENSKALTSLWFEEIDNVSCFMNFRTTKELSLKEYSTMGIKILVFHMDCLDCPECQGIHQKLNSNIQHMEKNGYTILVYYCRSDQDVFETFRTEFNNKIDYVIVDDVQEQFLEGHICNSSLFEIHGNEITNRYNHSELSIAITDFCSTSDQEVIETHVKSPDLSPRSTAGLSLPLDFFNNSDTSSPRKISFGEPIFNSILLKRFSHKVASAFSPRVERFATSPTSSVNSNTTETTGFSMELDSQPNTILQHSLVKDALGMGFRVLLFHMDNLRCQHCLDFHKNLDANLNVLLGEMITPLLNYTRSDQHLFELLNKYTKNKIEVVNIPEISDIELHHFDKCSASVVLILDEENFDVLTHEEISMKSLAKSFGFSMDGITDVSVKTEQKENKPMETRKGSIINIFKKSGHKVDTTARDSQTSSSGEYTPKFIIESLTLDDVLKDDRLRSNFLEYLKQECAEENIMFYEYVQQYKQLGWSERKLHAKEMVKLFLDKNSKYELNTTAKMKNKIKKRLKHGKPDLFDELLNNTLMMLDFDVLKRFLETQTL